jgi:hypothetical protein
VAVLLHAYKRSPDRVEMEYFPWQMVAYIRNRTLERLLKIEKLKDIMIVD